MSRRVFPILVAAFTSLATVQAQNYTATLSPEQDGGGARTGTGSFTLSLSGTTITVNGSYSGLSGTAFAGHIHGPSDPFPASAGVLYDFSALGLATFGGMAGTVSGTFSLVPKTVGGNPYTVEQQIADLNNNRWYVNIHSSPNFGGGEVRGQILVPEPTTTGLLLTGAVAGLVLWMRRRSS